MSKISTNSVLREPYYSPPAQQLGAHTLSWFCSLILAAAAFAAGCLPLARYNPERLGSAVIYEMGQIWIGLSNVIWPWAWPWELQLPLWIAMVAGIIGHSIGWQAGFRPGWVRRQGTVIVTPDKLYDKADGLGLGGATLSRQAETNGILLVAGQGGGKTVPIVKMLKQVWERHERALILDDKPEFAGQAPNLHGDGRGVTDPNGPKSWLLALADTRAARWAVGEDVHDRLTASRWATSLVSGLDTSSMTGGDFWVEGASIFIETAILICIRDFGTGWGLGDFFVTLMGLIRLPVVTLKDLVYELYPAGAAIVTTKAGNTLDGFLANLAVALKPIDLMVRFESMKRGPTISLTRWLTTRDHLIIGSAAPNRKAGTAYANSLIELAAELLLFRPDAQPDDSNAATWLFLDEFGAAGRCELLTHELVKFRSKGVRTVMGIQSLQQLAETYSEKRAEIIAGSLATQILGRNLGGEDGDAGWASKQIGRAVGDAWTPPNTPGQPGKWSSEPIELVPSSEFAKLGPIEKAGKIVGVRTIIMSSSRAAELYFPVTKRRVLRRPIVTAPVPVDTPIIGRIAPTVARLAATED